MSNISGATEEPLTADDLRMDAKDFIMRHVEPSLTAILHGWGPIADAPYKLIIRIERTDIKRTE